MPENRHGPAKADGVLNHPPLHAPGPSKGRGPFFLRSRQSSSKRAVIGRMTHWTIIAQSRTISTLGASGESHTPDEVPTRHRDTIQKYAAINVPRGTTLPTRQTDPPDEKSGPSRRDKRIHPTRKADPPDETSDATRRDRNGTRSCRQARLMRALTSLVAPRLSSCRSGGQGAAPVAPPLDLPVMCPSLPSRANSVCGVRSAPA